MAMEQVGAPPAARRKTRRNYGRTLGVAATLNEMKDSLSGKVKFIFQPAEETLSGAQAMRSIPSVSHSRS